MMNYVYRRCGDPYYWKWYISGARVYKFATLKECSAIFEMVE